MENKFNYLSNLESSLSELQTQNNLINLLINGYFDIPIEDINKRRIELAWNYKVYRSLALTIEKNLREITKNMEQNIYPLYKILTGGKQ